MVAQRLGLLLHSKEGAGLTGDLKLPLGVSV